MNENRAMSQAALAERLKGLGFQLDQQSLEGVLIVPPHSVR